MNTQQNSLQMIYSLVLGIIFTILVGVGINTFYPYPETYNSAEMKAINEKSNDCYDNYSDDYGSTAADRKKQDTCMKNVEKEREALQDELSAKGKNWGVVTSIILISIATITIALSLLMSESLHIISNGLMLGSFFTLLGGVGTSFFSEQKMIRFVILIISFLITIGIGYLVFIKRNQKNYVQPVEVGPDQNQLNQ